MIPSLLLVPLEETLLDDALTHFGDPCICHTCSMSGCLNVPRLPMFSVPYRE